MSRSQRIKSEWGQGENFIPWSQIEPLVTPGMTGREIALAILAKLGLSHERHRALTRFCHPWENMRDVIQDGVEIISVDEERKRRKASATRAAGRERI